ncbi:MAG: hypothetical protein FWH22_08750 [Fibromonadales bacterium]|nr:hypothetical protein [Fibromonadales bacterium]
MRLFFILFFACLAYANFDVNPATIKMRISRGEYNGWADITHAGGHKPVAVELTMYERIFDLDGNVKDTLIPNKDFVVYPSQILLYPGGMKKVQIVYRGKTKIDADRVYSLLAEEKSLPQGKADENETRIGIAFRVNYNISVLMESGKRSELKFVSSKTLDSGMVEVIMENAGKGRFSFQDMNLYIGKEKITDFAGKKNAVMPGQQRRFIFKYPRAVKANEIRFVK